MAETLRRKRIFCTEKSTKSVLHMINIVDDEIHLIPFHTFAEQIYECCGSVFFGVKSPTDDESIRIVTDGLLYCCEDFCRNEIHRRTRDSPQKPVKPLKSKIV